MNLMFVMGTRPEAIKLAPVILEARNKGINCQLVETGQHDYIVEQTLEEFGIEGITNINKTSCGNQTLSYSVGHMLEELSDALSFGSIHLPDVCIVQGDTSSTLVGALWAFYNKVPVAHVEAGLRSGNMYSPFPEEINRKLVSRIATYNFCPTSDNLIALFNEGVSKTSCYLVGNTIIDAIDMVLDPNHQFKDDRVNKLLKRNKVITMTMHRRENWELMEDIFTSINEVVHDYEDVKVIFPVNLNPYIMDKAHKIFGENNNVLLLNPLSYPDFANLISRSYFLVTDSGGIQEEACYVGKKTLVLRRETERREGVLAGVCSMVGVSPKDIKNTIRKSLFEDCSLKAFKSKDVYGDGHASERIIGILNSKDRRDIYAYRWCKDF